jgi:hypothetical protein
MGSGVALKLLCKCVAHIDCLCARACLLQACLLDGTRLSGRWCTTQRTIFGSGLFTSRLQPQASPTTAAVMT